MEKAPFVNDFPIQSSNCVRDFPAMFDETRGYIPTTIFLWFSYGFPMVVHPLCQAPSYAKLCQAAMLRSELLLEEFRVHMVVVGTHALVGIHLPKQGTLHHLLGKSMGTLYT